MDLQVISNPAIVFSLAELGVLMDENSVL